MEYIRLGIVGIGNIGSMHTTNVYQNLVEGMKLVAVCDLRESRLEWCRSQFPGISLYTDYKEMFQSGELDAVIISVPHRQHAEIAMDALAAGLHVLVEKPIDVTVTQAQKLNEVAKQSDRVFAIMFNQRTNLLFQKAREIVQGGLLGELKRSVWIITNWYRTQHYYDSGEWRATWKGEGGGVLLNQALHNLDLWQWICGMPVSIRAFCDVAKYHRIEVEDEATIYAKYANGATGVFITSTGEYPGTNRLEISGDKGKIVLENSTLKWWRLPKREREICYESEENFPVIECEYEEFKLEEKESGHLGIVQNFANAILHGEQLISPGFDGIYELSISNAAYLSEWSGNAEITMPLDSARFDSLLEERSAHSEIHTGAKPAQAESSDAGNSKRWQIRW